jgi:hypothetical protein
VNKFQTTYLVALVIGLFSTTAFADVGVNVKVGTLGLGAEVSNSFTDKFSVGVGFNTFSITKSQTAKDVDYDAKLKLQSISLLASYHPFAGVFRLTAGLLADDNKLTMTGKPNSSGNFTLNGNTYTASEVGTLNAKLTFNSAAPYFGIGWGNRPNSHWGATADIGVLYQGSPKLALNATGAAANPSLASDIEQERAKEESDLSNFKWWPVISLGAYYHF